MLGGLTFVFNAALFIGGPEGQQGGDDAGNGQGFAEHAGMEVEEGLVTNVSFISFEGLFGRKVGFRIS